MPYDPRHMFCDIAPVSEPSKTPWFKCEDCGKEYSKEILAKGCHEAHVRYGRKPTTMFPEVPKQAPVEERRKAEVFWIDSTRAICGLCSSKEKEAELLLRVEMLEPPVCSRCHKQIEPEPLKLIENPNFLPPSERREIRRLAVTRRAKVERNQQNLHKQLVQVEARSIMGPIGKEHADLVERGNALDTRLTNEFGEYRNPKESADQRFERFGEIEVDETAEPVEWKFGDS